MLNTLYRYAPKTLRKRTDGDHDYWGYCHVQRRDGNGRKKRQYIFGAMPLLSLLPQLPLLLIFALHFSATATSATEEKKA